MKKKELTQLSESELETALRITSEAVGAEMDAIAEMDPQTTDLEELQNLALSLAAHVLQLRKLQTEEARRA